MAVDLKTECGKFWIIVCFVSVVLLVGHCNGSYVNRNVGFESKKLTSMFEKERAKMQ
jgi:hypothetical protein